MKSTLPNVVINTPTMSVKSSEKRLHSQPAAHGRVAPKICSLGSAYCLPSHRRLTVTIRRLATTSRRDGKRRYMPQIEIHSQPRSRERSRALKCDALLRRETIMGKEEDETRRGSVSQSHLTTGRGEARGAKKSPMWKPRVN